ncbi:MAG: LptF/LptG family permease [Verrucomicrobia bacterium]|nr:LptF/LptG family permease [Verrucomicrobiota bacterium]
MKIIDKYVIGALLLPLVYLLMSFCLLFIVFDLFDNLPDLIQAGTPPAQVVRLYLNILPSNFIYIAPISLLLATLYSLSQLTRHNELTAMRASGLSLYRLMVPYMAIGLTASVLVAAVNETIGPESAYWAQQFIRSQRHKGEKNVHIAQNLAYKHPDGRRVWMIREFETRTFEMKQVEVIQQREDASDEVKYQAAEGKWLDGRWWFSDVTVQKLDPDGYPMGPPRYEFRLEMSDFSERPEDFLNEIREPRFLSSRALLKFIDSHHHLSDASLARYRVDYHYRLALPWTCLVVTLLGIPFGSQTGRKGALLGALLSISWFFGLYFMINVCLVLGKKQILAPWLAAWFPNLAFLGVGIYMIRRMR